MDCHRRNTSSLYLRRWYISCILAIISQYPEIKGRTLSRAISKLSKVIGEHIFRIPKATSYTRFFSWQSNEIWSWKYFRVGCSKGSIRSKQKHGLIPTVRHKTFLRQIYRWWWIEASRPYLEKLPKSQGLHRTCDNWPNKKMEKKFCVFSRGKYTFYTKQNFVSMN